MNIFLWVLASGDKFGRSSCAFGVPCVQGLGCIIFYNHSFCDQYPSMHIQ